MLNRLREIIRLVDIQLLLAVAALLRIVGLFWGFPRIYNVDEERMLTLAVGIVNQDPQPVHSDYGPLPHLLVVPLYRLIEFFGFGPSDSEMWTKTLCIAAIGRVVAVIAALCTIYLTFRLGERFFSRVAGMLGAAILTFAPIHVQMSKVYVTDVFLCLFSAGVLYFGALAIATRSWKHHCLTGIMIGLAMGTKLTSVVLYSVWPLTFLVLMLSRDGRQSLGAGADTRGVIGRSLRELGGPVLGVVVSIAVFLAIVPDAILEPRKFWWIDIDSPCWWNYLCRPGGSQTFFWNLLMTSGAIEPSWTWASSHPWWEFRSTRALIWTVGPVALLIPLGLWHCLRRQGHEGRLIALLVMTQYLAIGLNRVHFVRYSLFYLVGLALLAAVGVMQLVSFQPRMSGRALRTGVGALALSALGLTAAWGVAFVGIYLREDVRHQAARWMTDNLPAGARVGMEYAAAIGQSVNLTQHKNEFFQWANYFDLPHLAGSWFHPERSPLIRLAAGARRLRIVDWGYRPDLAGDLQAFLADVDYLVVSSRWVDQLTVPRPETAEAGRFYAELFDGAGEFKLMKTFRSLPTLFGLQIDDSVTEHTFRIFDHPTVWLFVRKNLRDE